MHRLLEPESTMGFSQVSLCVPQIARLVIQFVALASPSSCAYSVLAFIEASASM